MNNKGIYSGPLYNQLSQLQSLYPNLKGFDIQALTQNPNPNLFQFDQQFNTNPQNVMNYLNSAKSQPQHPVGPMKH